MPSKAVAVESQCAVESIDGHDAYILSNANDDDSFLPCHSPGPLRSLSSVARSASLWKVACDHIANFHASNDLMHFKRCVRAKELASLPRKLFPDEAMM